MPKVVATALSRKLMIFNREALEQQWLSLHEDSEISEIPRFSVPSTCFALTLDRITGC